MPIKLPDAQQRSEIGLPLQGFGQQLYAIQRAIDDGKAAILQAARDHGGSQDFAHTMKVAPTDDYFTHATNLMIGGLALSVFGMNNIDAVIANPQVPTDDRVRGYFWTKRAVEYLAESANMFAGTRNFSAAAMVAEVAVLEAHRFINGISDLHRLDEGMMEEMKTAFERESGNAAKYWYKSIMDESSSPSYLMRLFRALYFSYGSDTPEIAGGLPLLAAEMTFASGETDEGVRHHLRSIHALLPFTQDEAHQDRWPELWGAVKGSLNTVAEAQGNETTQLEDVSGLFAQASEIRASFDS